MPLVPSPPTDTPPEPSKSETAIAQIPPPYADDDPENDDLDDSGGRMAFLDHLDELRKRIMMSVAAIVMGFVVVFVPLPPVWNMPIDYIFAFIMRPLTEVLPTGGTLVFTEPAEAFFLYFKVAGLAALFLASPVILLQVWMFVAPGLYSHEKRLTIPFVGIATMCFVGGAMFAHFIAFPAAWRFFASFSTDYMTFLPRIQPTFALYVKLLLGLGIAFQLPTVVLFLSRIGVVTPRFLIRNTKYAILIIFVIAAIVTPSADPVNQSLIAAPMILLYGLSIGIAWAFGKKRTL